MTSALRLGTALLLLLLASVAAVAAPAHAGQTGDDQRDGTVRVSVIEVSGLIDDVLADFVTDAIAKAERDRVEVLVIRLDSEGGVIDEPALGRLSTRLHHARVPVAVWIGEHRGAVALGQAFELIESAWVAGAVPRARLGDLGAQPQMGARDALEDGVLDLLAPTLGDFIIGLDGRSAPGGRVSIPTRQVRAGGTPHRELARPVRVGFAEPSLLAQLLHAVATPSAAYVLVVIAGLLVIFEFFSVGIGIAAAVAAGCLVLAGYGLAVLPVRPAGLGLLVIAAVGLAIDLQAGLPRAWTGIAVVAFAAGSVVLFGDGLAVPWPVVAITLAGVVVFALSGMPAMIRTRFSTQTIGREWLIGERGVAITEVAPDGTVRVRDAAWTAHTNRATPIAAGAGVRVVAVDGPLLEVEPDGTDGL